jgi:hypothetical protein
MLVRLRNVVVLVAIGAFLATAVVVEIFDASNRPHVSINQKTTADEDKCTDHQSLQECTEEAIATYNKWIARFTAILAIATIGLGVATFGLYLVNHNQLKHGRRVERAYVKMSHRAPGIMFGTKPSIDLMIQVKNYGRTPARVSGVIITPIVWPKDTPLPANPAYVNFWKVGKTPGGFLVCDDHFVIDSTTTISEEEYSAVREGTHDVIVVGYVDYIDQFERHHRSGYAARYDRHRDDPTNLVSINERVYEYDRERVPGEGNDWNEGS